MPYILALVDDLMVLSRIREAARGAGLEVRTPRRPSDVLAGVRDGGRIVLVDADSGRLSWAESLAALRENAGGTGSPSVVGFYSHVHSHRAEDARAAGCDRVLPRSAFVKELPGLLAEAAAHRNPSEEPTS
jgi:hypothetical protein